MVSLARRNNNTFSSSESARLFQEYADAARKANEPDRKEERSEYRTLMTPVIVARDRYNLARRVDVLGESARCLRICTRPGGVSSLCDSLWTSMWICRCSCHMRTIDGHGVSPTFVLSAILAFLLFSFP